MYYLLAMAASFCCIDIQNAIDIIFPEYWFGKVPTDYNGSTGIQTPFFMESNVYKYYRIGRDDAGINDVRKTIDDPNRIGVTIADAHPSNKPPENVTGTYRKATFTSGKVLNVETLTKFFNNSASVLVATTWYAIDPEDHINVHLTQAIAEGTVLNITFNAGFLPLTEAQSNSLNQNKLHEIDLHLCFYQGSATTFTQGHCYINYTKLIDYYLTMWAPDKLTPVALNGELFRCTNNQDAVNAVLMCRDNFDPLNLTYYTICNDLEDKYTYGIRYMPQKQVFISDTYRWYAFNSNPSGVGYTTNITYGHNNTVHSHDINLTVLFTKWTFDFPRQLLYNFRDQSYNYDEMKLEIHYWTKDPPPKPVREVPDYLWLMIFIMAGPFGILFLGVLLFLCTRSRKAFDVRIWDYRSGLSTDVLTKMRKQQKFEEFEESRVEKKRQFEMDYIQEPPNTEREKLDTMVL